MRKEVTVKIPARKASTTKKVKITCDFCGKDATPGSYGSGGGTCRLCNRDICDTHKKYDPEDWGDYPGKYCPSCYELKFVVYKSKREQIEEKHEKTVEALDKKMRKESLKE